MSITVTQTEISHRYLMNKSKYDLWWMLQDMRKRAGIEPAIRLPLDATTKDSLATEIMVMIRVENLKDAAEPQAFRDLDIPLGTVVTDDKGLRWVFVGWASTSMSKEAYLVRELQPGERLTPVNPWGYHCTKTATLLARFPALEAFRK